MDVIAELLKLIESYDDFSTAKRGFWKYSRKIRLIRHCNLLTKRLKMLSMLYHLDQQETYLLYFVDSFQNLLSMESHGAAQGMMAGIKCTLLASGVLDE